MKGWQGLVEDEEDWWKRNGVSCQNLKHKLVMNTGEDCRYLWVFWSGLLVCLSAGPGASAPQTKLGSWGGVGVTWGGMGINLLVGAVCHGLRGAGHSQGKTE